MKFRIIYGISEIATRRDTVNDVLLEHKVPQMWLDYSCLYIRHQGSIFLKQGCAAAGNER